MLAPIVLCLKNKIQCSYVCFQSCPPKKGYIRGISYLTGYLIREQGPHKCQFNYVSQSDPRGKCKCPFSEHWFMIRAKFCNHSILFMFIKSTPCIILHILEIFIRNVEVKYIVYLRALHRYAICIVYRYLAFDRYVKHFCIG